MESKILNAEGYEIDLKALCEALLNTNPRIPVTYIKEKKFCFRGDVIELQNMNAYGARVRFAYSDLDSMISGLETFGLRISEAERNKIYEWYALLKKQDIL
jgi:excinuclease UvrABC helicase subunit UvrB